MGPAHDVFVSTDSDEWLYLHHTAVQQKQQAMRLRHVLLLNMSAANLKLIASGVPQADGHRRAQQVVVHCTEVIDAKLAGLAEGQGDVGVAAGGRGGTFADEGTAAATSSGGAAGGESESANVSSWQTNRVKALYRRAQANVALGNADHAVSRGGMGCVGSAMPADAGCLAANA